MTSLRLPTLVLCVFLAQAALAANDYWVWKDDNGVVNFSQQRPKDRPAKHVVEGGPHGYKETLEDSRRPGMAPPPDETSKQPPPPAADKSSEQVNPDKLIAAQKEKLMRQVAATKRKNCEQAQRNLQSLQRPRIRTKGADGEVRVMSQQEQQQQIDQAQAAIRDNCSN